MGYVFCSQGHFVCDECHGKRYFGIITDMLLMAQNTDPVLIAEGIIQATGIPMLGCEHAWIASGSLLAAIRSTGKIKVTGEQITEALNRTRKQAISAYCGLTGVCGVAPAIGAAFSVILGAGCPKDQETAVTMRVVSRIVNAIANETGPCCCKNFVRTALGLSRQLSEEYLQVKLSSGGAILCRDSHRHPHGCRETKCRYYNAETGAVLSG